MVGAVAFVVLLVTQLTTSHGDAGLFADAGHRLMHGDLDVFSTSALQVGPTYLVLVGLGSLLTAPLHAPHWAGAALATSAASAVLLVAVLGAIAPSGRRGVSGLGVIVGGALVIPATYGHPEEAMTAFLLVLATTLAFRGHALSPPLLLAAAVTIKLWAVVAVGLLLVAGSRRLVATRGLVLVAAVVGAYLPFEVLGRVSTFDFAWQVEVPAPLSLVMHDGSSFAYRQRLLQVAVAALLGAVVAWRARGPEIAWALPLVVMSARLLLDPLSNPYYWTTLVVVVVLVQVARARTLLEGLLTAYLSNIALLLAITTAQGRPGAAVLTGFGLAALAGGLGPAWSRRDHPRLRAVAAAA